MIRVRVELISAINGSTRELARMDIANDGQSAMPSKGHYNGVTYFGRGKEIFDRPDCRVSKIAKVTDWPREAYHVWNLVAKMLREMGYTKGQT